MAKLYEGLIDIASTLTPTGTHPLDDRNVVEKIADLTDDKTFNKATYNGMPVYVEEDGCFYVLKDRANVNSLSAWTKLQNKVGLSIENDGTGITAKGNAITSIEVSDTDDHKLIVSKESFSHSNHTHNASAITEGIISIERLPHGALERCVVVETNEERFGLTTKDVQKGDTVKVTKPGVSESNPDGSPMMYYVVDDGQLGNESGYQVYTAGTATSAPWGGITGKPNFFMKVKGNSDGIAESNELDGTLKVATPSGDPISTSAAAETLTIEHAKVTKNEVLPEETDPAEQLDYEGTFNIIDSVTYDDYGHTSGSVKKKVKLPAKYVHPTMKRDQQTDTPSSPGHSGTVTLLSNVLSDDEGHVQKLETTTVTMPGDDCLTSEEIVIKGGPLSDEATRKIFPDGKIPANTDVRFILKELLCQELWPESVASTPGSITGSIAEPKITFAPADNIVEFGSSINVIAESGASKYNVSGHNVSGMTYGYCSGLTETDICEHTETEVTAGSSVTFASMDVKLALSGKVTAEKTGTAAGVSIKGNKFTPTVGSNTVTASNTGATYTATFEPLPSYYLCTNLGHTKTSKVPQGKATQAIEGGTQTTIAPVSSISKTVTCVYPIFSSIKNGAISSAPDEKLELRDTDEFIFENVPSENVSKNHFKMIYPAGRTVVSFQVRDLSRNWVNVSSPYTSGTHFGEIAGKEYLLLETTGEFLGEGNSYRIVLSKATSVE